MSNTETTELPDDYGTTAWFDGGKVTVHDNDAGTPAEMKVSAWWTSGRDNGVTIAFAGKLAQMPRDDALKLASALLQAVLFVDS
jgi:hypothetical protein